MPETHPNRRRRRPWTAAALVCGGLGALSAPQEAQAVRPFVTDDARIISKGQFELEMWPDLKWQRRKVQPGFNLVAGTSVTEWLEILAGGGIGLNPGPGLSLPNPMVQGKLLLWRAEDDGVPGLALVAGTTLPVGRGADFDPATGVFVLAPITTRLADDALMFHINLGMTAAIPPRGSDRERVVRSYWGVGFDAAIFHPDVRMVWEAYAGDPFESLGPRYAFQWGGRWLPSERVNLDLTFGAQPPSGHYAGSPRWEKWAQVGIRLLFDVYTKDGRPGDPMGARGLWRRRGRG